MFRGISGLTLLFTVILFGAPPSVAVAQEGMPQVTRDSPKKRLKPTGLYRVEFICKSKGQLPEDTFDAFIQTNTAASLLIAVSEDNVGTTPTPQNSKALVSVYNVGGPATSRTRYLNEACNGHPFFVAPRKSLTIVAAESKIDSRTLGPGLKAIEAGVKVLTSILPLFTGVPVTGMISNRLSAVSNTDAPIAAFVSAFDKGLSGITSKELTEGHTRINATFATIDVYVTELRSIVGIPDNGQFRADLETAVSSQVKPAFNATSPNNLIETSCSATAGSLERLYNFSREDIAFSLVLIGQLAGLNSSAQFIHCLGDYAATAVQESFVNRLGKGKIFNEKIIKTVLPIRTLVAQPDFVDIQSELVSLMRLLRSYTLLETPLSFAQTALGKTGMAARIAIEDEAEMFDGISSDTDGLVSSADVMVRLKAKGFQKFGCLMPDNGAVTFFLAVPGLPSVDKTYKYSDALLLRAWVDSDTKVSRLRASIEGDQIAAVVARNKQICGQSVIFADK